MKELQGRDAEWMGPVGEDLLVEVEEQLGLKFPEQYRTFLQEHGCGAVGHLEIYGVGCDPSSPPSLQWLIRDLEGDSFLRPAPLLPICDVGNGDYFAILAAPLDNQPASAIVAWTPNHDGPLELAPVAPSFAKWLEMLFE